MVAAVDFLTDRFLLIGVLLNDGSHWRRINLERIVNELFGSPRRAVLKQLCFFSPPDIDYRHLTVRATVYDRRRGAWTPKIVPFPKIVYLREGLAGLGPEEVEKFAGAVLATRSLLANNRIEFNKWEIYRILAHNPELKFYLPETRLSGRGFSLLDPMLRKYGELYLKGCRGRRGEQVMQVILHSPGHYECRYHHGRTVSRQARSYGEVLALINGFFRRQEFILQQPIDLLTFNGRKIDMRAEMQRNGRGELKLVATPVRVGRGQSPITTHASSYPFEKYFKEVLAYNKARLQELKSRMERLLYKTYRTVEGHYGSLGEIGIDIGLDKSGKLWIIECNPLSAKVSLMKAYGEKTMRTALLNPLDYALYKAGKGRSSLLAEK